MAHLSEKNLNRNGRRPGQSLEAARSITERLRRRQDLGAELVRYVEEAVPAPLTLAEPAYRAGVEATVTALVRYALAALELSPGFSESVPTEVAEQARGAARAAMSCELVVRRYMAADRRLGELIDEQARGVGVSVEGPTLAMLHRARYALLEQVLVVAVREHEAERARIAFGSDRGSAQQRREEIVLALLAGAPPTPQQRAMLRYELDAWHFGLVVGGGGARGAVPRLARNWAGEILSVQRGEHRVWAWLGTRSQVTLANVRQLLFTLASDIDVSIAAGEAAWGWDGMRRTHLQAQAAAGVARGSQSRLTSFDDVALEAAALQDRALGDALIARWLSPLDGPRDGGLRRRSVLRALLAAEGNRSSAAHALGVDRETVRRRVAEIEERLGRRLSQCQSEIDIALRVEELRLREGPGGRVTR